MYGLICPHCSLQTDVDPALLTDESPMPYCPCCGGALIENEDYCFENDEDDFQPCDKCDGHDACADFGCAFELGLGHLVKNQNPSEW